MELLRPDFLHYISAIRQSLAAIQTEQTSAKAIDDIDCIDACRMLLQRHIPALWTLADNGDISARHADISVPAMLYCETDKPRLGSSSLLSPTDRGRKCWSVRRYSIQRG